jgi:hypothetical protein
MGGMSVLLLMDEGTTLALYQKNARYSGALASLPDSRPYSTRKPIEKNNKPVLRLPTSTYSYKRYGLAYKVS